jgi:hypothetical protein
MTKALSSYPDRERFQIAKRRLDKKAGGLGFWAAKDAQVHFGKPKTVEVTEPLSDESASTNQAQETK